MHIGLKVLKPFQQGKNPQYKVGAHVPNEHWTGWEATTLANRLQNGWVVWEPVSDETAAPDEPDIHQLDKAGLLEYAQQRFDARLDGRASERTLREQIGAMIDRAAAIAKATGGKKALQAARSGESAGNGGASRTPATPPVPLAAAPPADDPAAPGGGDATNESTGGGRPPPAP